MQYSLLAQLTARDPSKVVRFPELPLDDAIASLGRMAETLEKLQQALAAQPPAAAPTMGSMPPVLPASTEAAPGEGSGVPETLGGPIASLATQVWRARNRLVDPETGEPREETRRVFRHVEAACEVFQQMGVVIKDWLKQPYDAGLPVKVITFQPTPQIQRDTVIEAVRPTVIWKDQLLQMGEVIVAIPENTEQPHS